MPAVKSFDRWYDFDDDEVVVVEQPLPRIPAVAPFDGFHVAVTWHSGARAGEREAVDLGDVPEHVRGLAATDRGNGDTVTAANAARAAGA